MPGFLLNTIPTVKCAHGGTASATIISKKVFVDGKPVVIQPDPFAVAACPFTTPAGNPLPCLKLIWSKPSTKITTDLMPVLLTDSMANTIPNAVPVIITPSQTKVTGS